MAWLARLDLQYRQSHTRVVSVHQHSGPLRILQSLYPEGPEVCHNVLVHPPGGLVGGDTLQVSVEVAEGCHALITTPGATRFYRSEGAEALQQTRLRLQRGARLEWLPLEAIAYSGCQARNLVHMQLDPDAQLLAWDITALGLPHADQPFVAGAYAQTLQLQGVWLERGQLEASDTRLLKSPLGLADHHCMATLVFACGSALPRDQREHALEQARALIAAHPLAATAGATSPDARLLLVRALASQVEPVTDLFRSIRNQWRALFWQRAAVLPRIWSM